MRDELIQRAAIEQPGQRIGLRVSLQMLELKAEMPDRSAARLMEFVRLVIPMMDVRESDFAAAWRRQLDREPRKNGERGCKLADEPIDDPY